VGGRIEAEGVETSGDGVSSSASESARGGVSSLDPTSAENELRRNGDGMIVSFGMGWVESEEAESPEGGIVLGGGEFF